MKHIHTNATTSDEITEREINNRKLARQAAAESIVLLQNDGILPINPGSIALYGAGASATIKGGTGSGEVNERYSVTIEQGLINSGFTITTDSYLREYEKLLREEKESFRKTHSKSLITGSADERINFMAEQFRYPVGRLITAEEIKNCGTETCIYVIARQAGESADRRLDLYDYNLTQTEIDNLRLISASFGKAIVLINAGAQMDISQIGELDVNAVIYFCQQGMEGGSALADILTGAVTPSGCLASTWARKYEDIPNAMEYSYLKGHTDFEEYKEDIYVGYRYFDSFGITPAYEFGYGLSYTEFLIENVEISAKKSHITCLVKVTNTGARYSGKKTVQLYVSAPSGKLRREYQSLAAFAKTKTLAPGESETLELHFEITDLAGYDEDTASFILEQGDYIVRTGGSSINTQVAAVFSLDNTIAVEMCENICTLDRELVQIKPDEIVVHAIPAEIKKLSVFTTDITTITHDYKMPEPKISENTKKILEKLNISDMLKVVCGTGVYDSAPQFMAQGAAAYTTSHLAKMGVPNAVLCDGPAGVRLQKTSVRKKRGKVKPVGVAMEIMEDLPNIAKKYMQGNPAKGDLLYQYATAFPVGTALAQTWNTSLLGKVGAAIGAEMAEYGVTFWLAPGINIHRNPLCGRNFEYYSEDPFLTGKLAAAVIGGVQSHDGCYATIKHYAANNQETNRNKTNSIVSERALREIYLKGYRIAIKESGAKAVMTSYNKVNGVYTPNSFDLCTKLLRCEWGFDGVVMTDWFSTGEGLADNGGAIKAGNDLIMPGGRWYTNSLKEALNAGDLSADDLYLCCARVLEAVLSGRTGIVLK